MYFLQGPDRYDPALTFSVTATSRFHKQLTAKIIKFDPMKRKSPNVPLQDEPLTWTSQLRPNQP